MSNAVRCTNFISDYCSNTLFSEVMAGFDRALHPDETNFDLLKMNVLRCKKK